MSTPTVDLDLVRTDLVAEQEALDEVVAALDPAQWALATPSPRWSIADQIGHLTYFDRTAALAIADPDGFAEHRAEVFGASVPEGDDLDSPTLGEFRVMSPVELLSAWRDARSRLADAAATLADGDRVEWYGPSMGAKSFLTARLMEAWAHGQDVRDTVGVAGEPTVRLLHIAQLGVITRKWSFLVRGEEPPADDVAVVLAAPDGGTWSWHADGATPEGGRVGGSAEGFCQVVTQRRHPDDTDLVVTGNGARAWIDRAQAFAGGATSGPAARS